MLSKEEYKIIKPYIESSKAETYLKDNDMGGFWSACMIGAPGTAKDIMRKFLVDEIKIPFFDKKWTIISPDSFSGMHGTIEIPSTVKKLANGAFRGSLFSEIIFKSGSIITNIPEQCFKDTSELTYVKLPDAAEYLDIDAFENTNNKIRIKVNDDILLDGRFSYALEDEDDPTLKDNKTETFYKTHVIRPGKE